MMKLTEEFKRNVAEEVAKYESKTSGEIVPVLFSSSDLYPASHYRSGLLCGVLGYFLAYVFDLNYSLPFFPLYCFIAFFIIGFYLAYIGIIKRMMTLRREFDEEVRQKATEMFFQLGAHNTKKRNGVLIFISLVERRIVIMGDQGIHEKVGPEFWDKIVTDMIPFFKNKQVLEAFKYGIDKVGEVLAEHFPRQIDDSNELKNELHHSPLV